MNGNNNKIEYKTFFREMIMLGWLYNFEHPVGIIMMLKHICDTDYILDNEDNISKFLFEAYICSMNDFKDKITFIQWCKRYLGHDSPNLSFFESINKRIIETKLIDWYNQSLEAKVKEAINKYEGVGAMSFSKCSVDALSDVSDKR